MYLSCSWQVFAYVSKAKRFGWLNCVPKFFRLQFLRNLCLIICTKKHHENNNILCVQKYELYGVYISCIYEIWSPGPWLMLYFWGNAVRSPLRVTNSRASLGPRHRLSHTCSGRRVSPVPALSCHHVRLSAGSELSQVATCADVPFKSVEGVSLNVYLLNMSRL